MFSYLVAIALNTQSTQPASLFESASKSEISAQLAEIKLTSADINKISERLDIAETQLEGGDYAAAIDSYRQVLSLLEAQPQPDAIQKGEALDGLGYAYLYAENYNAALSVLEEALEHFTTLARNADASFTLAELADSDYADAIVSTVRSLGFIYRERANFGTSLRYYQLALQSDRPEIQLDSRFHIGLLQADLGQYEAANQTLNRVAQLSNRSGDGCLEASSLNTIGWVHERQENYEKAIAAYQTALDLFARYSEDQLQFCDRHSRVVRTFNNKGIAYLKQERFTQAKESFDEGFALLAAQDDPFERAILLDSLASLYQDSGDSAQAWRAYLSAWQLSSQNEDSIGEIDVLLNLGKLMEREQKPYVAVFFYKQAISRIEIVRQDLTQLSVSMQTRYTLTVEDFYRNLADLLLQQSREPEALQVLELLKLQEARAYLHDSVTTENKTVFNNAEEEALFNAFDALPLEITLSEFLTSVEVGALESTTAKTPELDEEDGFDSQAIASLNAILSKQPATTAVLYPLILKDRLEILLLTPNGNVERFTQQVSQEELSRTVADMQRSLKDPRIDAKPAAQALYRWLVNPLEATLDASEVENIIYLPDSFLRYVPLSAFHNGDSWLVEKYRSHNITAATVGDLVKENSSELSVMAGAFTDSQQMHEVQVGSDTFQYSGLSAAKQEIDNLERAVPNTVALLNSDFTADRMLGSVGDRKILHLATHAQFVPGQPEDSFILFGDGGTVNMREMRDWKLPAVDLVVLSACQTASSTDGEGKEILGLGFQVQKTGAGAAIASLWSVDDSATAALMSQFYKALSQGQTKAQALKTAQRALLGSDLLSDPHDWAAFILIGNGL